MPFRLGVVYENGIIRFTSDEFETLEEVYEHWKPGEIIFIRVEEEQEPETTWSEREPIDRDDMDEIVMRWRREVLNIPKLRGYARSDF